MVLVLDDASTRITSSLLGMYDLMELRVTTVESLASKRQPLPEMSVVYLISSSPSSVDAVIKDFQDPKKPMYGDCHLYFLTRVADEEMNKIKRCKPLLSRIKAFNEASLDFLAVESHVFHFDMPSTFRSLYRRPPGSTVAVDIADKLVTVAATLNEYPHVRYKRTSAVGKEIAEIFQSKMNDFVASNPSWWYHGGQGHSEKSRGTILILDRSDDPLSPVVHEFTYQAMCQDLLPMSEDKISYTPDESNSGKREAKDVLLNDNDPIWVELRPNHIADVITTLSDRIRSFVATNSGAALASSSGSDMTLSEMASALKQLPEYRETMGKLSQHMHVAHMCMDAFNGMNLLEVSDLEQSMATGTDSEGKALKVKDLVDNLIDCIAGIGNQDLKVRLIMIYIISQQGIKEEDRKRLFDAAGLTSEEKDMILALNHLGVTLQSAPPKSKSFSSMFRSRKLAAGRTDKESVYAMSRYVTAMKGTLTEMQDDKLSLDEYPLVMPMPVGGGGGGSATASARSVRRGGKKAQWAEGGSRWGSTADSSATPAQSGLAGRNFVGGRQIVFVAGGVTYSEVRAAYEVMTAKAGSCREVIIGGTTMLRPKDFLKGLKDLES